MLHRLWLSDRNEAGPAKRTMKCCFTLCALVSLLPTMPATAGPEKSAYKQGREHEARENYEDAYEDYLRANESQPTNVKYRAALTRTRFLAAAAKVHRAILLRQSGRLGEALSLLEVAVKIDPSSAIAIQELENTRWMIQHSGAKSEQAQPRSDHVLSPDILDAQGPVKLGSIPNVPIALKLTEDVRINRPQLRILNNLGVEI